jgi:hypothetical protein
MQLLLKNCPLASSALSEKRTISGALALLDVKEGHTRKNAADGEVTASNNLTSLTPAQQSSVFASNIERIFDEIFTTSTSSSHSNQQCANHCHLELH